MTLSIAAGDITDIATVIGLPGTLANGLTAFHHFGDSAPVSMRNMAPDGVQGAIAFGSLVYHTGYVSFAGGTGGTKTPQIITPYMETANLSFAMVVRCVDVASADSTHGVFFMSNTGTDSTQSGSPSAGGSLYLYPPQTGSGQLLWKVPYGTPTYAGSSGAPALAEASTTWHYLCGSINATTRLVTLKNLSTGASATTTLSADHNLNGTVPWSLGSFTGAPGSNTWLACDMAQFALWNRVVSGAEFDAHYALEKAFLAAKRSITLP